MSDCGDVHLSKDRLSGIGVNIICPAIEGLFKFQENILSDLENNYVDESLKKFDLYLNDLKGRGSYSKKRWTIEWTNSAFDFSNLLQLKFSHHLAPYRAKLTSLIEETEDESHKEVLHFILCLLRLNLLNPAEQDVNFIKNITKLCKDYPDNFQFKFLSAFMLKVEDKNSEARDLYLEFISHWDGEMIIAGSIKRFLSDYIWCSYSVIRSMIRDRRYNKAKSEIVSLRNFVRSRVHILKFDTNVILPMVDDLYESIKDSMQVDKNIEESEDRVSKKIHAPMTWITILIAIFSVVIAIIGFKS